MATNTHASTSLAACKDGVPERTCLVFGGWARVHASVDWRGISSLRRVWAKDLNRASLVGLEARWCLENLQRRRMSGRNLENYLKRTTPDGGSVTPQLSEFELSTFFTFSRREVARIDSRRSNLHRLAFALHVGFLRMTGRPLDSCKQIPTVLWRHLGQQPTFRAQPALSMRRLTIKLAGRPSYATAADRINH